LDLFDGLNDVSARLLIHNQQNAGLTVLIGRHSSVRRAGDRPADVANSDRAAVVVGEGGFVERRWIYDLVVGGDGEARSLRIDGALRRNRSCADERVAHLLQREAAGGELGG